MEKDRKTATSYFLSTEIVALAYSNPQVYRDTFQTFQIKCHVRKIFHIRTTSIVSRAICKYYLINSIKVDITFMLQMRGARVEVTETAQGRWRGGNQPSFCLSLSLSFHC